MIVRLGDYVNIRTGKLDANASSDNGMYPFFTCSKEPLRIDTFSYECECVLVAGNGDLNVKYYNGKFDAYQRTYIIESNNHEILNVKYLFYFLDKYLETLRQQSIGGVIKYIKLGNIANAQFPLPELDKQRKITETLDKVSDLIAKRKQQLEKLDLLVKSRFVEMFGDVNINNMDFNVCQLCQCLHSIESGKSFVCSDEKRTGFLPAILKLSSVTYGEYNSKENKTLLDEKLFVNTLEIKKDDLLFTRKNTPELVGMCAYVYETPPMLMMPDLIFRLNTTESCNKIFLWKLINHDMFRKNIESISTGSAKSMSNISKERLGKLKIILPPIELQDQFAEFVKQTDQIKRIINQSLDKLETLKMALMQEYFG